MYGLCKKKERIEKLKSSLPLQDEDVPGQANVRKAMKWAPSPFACLSRAGIVLSLALLASCSSQRMYRGARADIRFGEPPAEELKEKAADGRAPEDTVTIEWSDATPTRVQALTGEHGNVAASVRLAQVTVTAGIKHIPGHQGMAEVDFVVSVPEALMHPKWQLNLCPYLYRDGNRYDLEELVVCGRKFRELQLKQYARYDKYLSKIVPDSLFDKRFLKTRAYHRYIAAHNRAQERKAHKALVDYFGYIRYKAKQEKRYACSEEDYPPEKTPRKYRAGRYSGEFEDTCELATASDSVFLKRMFLKNRQVARNQRRKESKHIALALTITHPFHEDAHLDTVVYGKGKFEYHYRQEVPAGEEGSRMSVCLGGYVMATDGNSWLLPRSDTLEYRVSSPVQPMDTTARFTRGTIERKAVSAVKANLTFRAGRYDMDIHPGDNRAQMDKVREMAGKLSATGELVLDSITIASGCSPEGSFPVNRLLSQRRAEAVRSYLAGELPGIPGIEGMLKVRSKGEDWQGLYRLVQEALDSPGKQAILELIAANTDPDKKEPDIQRKYPQQYRYIRDKLYPLLRAVEVTFHVHRKEMVEDTAHTAEPVNDNH